MKDFLMFLFSPVLVLGAAGVCVVLAATDSTNSGSGAIVYLLGIGLFIVASLVGLVAATVGGLLFGLPAAGLCFLGGYCVACWAGVAYTWFGVKGKK